MKPNATPPIEPPKEHNFPCPECHSGMMRLKYLTYFTWLNDELITVPNFPAWVCDMCGKREYDTRAISWLNTMLSPATGNRPSLLRKNRPQRLTGASPEPNELH
jgi:YgiT-type zinc finger domain-containing protein